MHSRSFPKCSTGNISLPLARRRGHSHAHTHAVSGEIAQTANAPRTRAGRGGGEGGGDDGLNNPRLPAQLPSPSISKA